MSLDSVHIAPLADHSIEDDSGHHRLIEHPQHGATDIERLVPLQKIQLDLSAVELVVQSSVYPVMCLITTHINTDVRAEF